MGFRPLHNFAELLPVIHLFKRKVSTRRSSDNQAVVPVSPYLVKHLVKVQQMLGADVLGRVCGRLEQVDLHLQRRVTQQTQQLSLCGDFCGHNIQDQNPQRPDILLAARSRDMTKIFSSLSTLRAGSVSGILMGIFGSLPYHKRPNGF